MEEYVLETLGLSKRYGQFFALKEVNIHVRRGAIYGFVGKNGAGKTTLILLNWLGIYLFHKHDLK